MQKSSFKTVAVLSLFFFLATPISVFALGSCPGGNCGAGSGNSGAGGLFGGGGGDGVGGLGAGLLIGQMLGSQGGAGGGGPAGQVGQVLSLVGALTGNMGLLIAGMITSMIGGLAGGATPQQGAVDEGYVGQGQGYGSGGGGGNPYYPTPTPATASPTPVAAACTSSVFIVKDTTVTPNVTKPYPATSSIAQNNCVLAINSDSASHTVQVKKQGETAASATQAVAASASHIFRFAAKSTYTLCVDGVSNACTTVTVQ